MCLAYLRSLLPGLFGPEGHRGNEDSVIGEPAVLKDTALVGQHGEDVGGRLANGPPQTGDLLNSQTQHVGSLACRGVNVGQECNGLQEIVRVGAHVLNDWMGLQNTVPHVPQTEVKGPEASGEEIEYEQTHAGPVEGLEDCAYGLSGGTLIQRYDWLEDPVLEVKSVGHGAHVEEEPVVARSVEGMVQRSQPLLAIEYEIAGSPAV